MNRAHTVKKRELVISTSQDDIAVSKGHISTEMRALWNLINTR